MCHVLHTRCARSRSRSESWERMSSRSSGVVSVRAAAVGSILVDSNGIGKNIGDFSVSPNLIVGR